MQDALGGRFGALQCQAYAFGKKPRSRQQGSGEIKASVVVQESRLAYAVTRGREEIVRLLIERDAVETLRSPEGETLSEIAQKAGHREIALILDGAAGRDEAPKLDKLPIYSLRIGFVVRSPILSNCQRSKRSLTGSERVVGTPSLGTILARLSQ